MLKKVLIVCVALTLATVLVGVAGSVSTQTVGNPSTASAAAVKSTTTTTTAHPIFLSYEQPTNLQLQSYTGPFVGSINSNVYHYPWCSDAKKILPKNLVTFATVADACAAGYRPCKVCDPPACSPTPTATPTAAPSASTVATPTPTAAPSASTVATPTPTITPTSTPAAASPSATPKPAAASTSTANVAQASVAPSSSSSTPGFEGIYALGALTAVFLALRITRRS
jgi:hypothetical protein